MRKKYKYEIDIYYGGLDSNKIFMSKPIVYHKNDKKRQMFPNEARLKNLTYGCNIFCDIDIVIRKTEDTEENEMLSITKQSIMEESIYNLNLKKNKKKEEVITFEKINMGIIPIMLHSKICVLNNNTFETLKNMGECPYEQGGYFIIDGKEKVIVSHEKKSRK